MLTVKQRRSIRHRIATLNSRMSLMAMIAFACILASALICEWNIIVSAVCLVPALICCVIYVKTEKEAQKLEDILYDDDTERLHETTDRSE